MSGFAITTFFQLLDLIIKAIIIAIFCDIAQINYNVMYFTNFHWICKFSYGSGSTSDNHVYYPIFWMLTKDRVEKSNLRVSRIIRSHCLTILKCIWRFRDKNYPISDWNRYLISLISSCKWNSSNFVYTSMSYVY